MVANLFRFPMFVSLLPFSYQDHVIGLSTAANNPLKTLLLDLRLSSSNSSIRVRVRKAAAILPVLELSCLGCKTCKQVQKERQLRLTRADTDSTCIRAACRAAIGVSYATAGDELRAIASADVGGTGNVGCDLSNRESRDCYDLVW